MCHIDELVHYRDWTYVSVWAFHRDHDLDELAYRMPGARPVLAPDWPRPTPDVLAAHGPRSANCRVALRIPEGDPSRVRDMELIFRATEGVTSSQETSGA